MRLRTAKKIGKSESGRHRTGTLMVAASKIMTNAIRRFKWARTYACIEASLRPYPNFGFVVDASATNSEGNPLTDGHGCIIRCDKYPLNVGDSFTLYSKQVNGKTRGFHHWASPGRYTIALVIGSAITIRHETSGSLFECEARLVHAILTDEWSRYLKSSGKRPHTIFIDDPLMPNVNQ